MFVGHYGAAFTARRLYPQVPLWVWFLAVQFVDVVWGVLILLGVEKLRIVPGITASNPLDLYFMPYTHSLVAAVLWSIAAYLTWRVIMRGRRPAGAAIGVAVAVGSHWVLDLVVHRPDLPLYGDTAKVGLGLWERPALAFAVEAGLLLGGLALYLQPRVEARGRMLVFAGLMLAIHAAGFFLLPPATAAMAALLSGCSYILFTAAAGRLEGA